MLSFSHYQFFYKIVKNYKVLYYFMVSSYHNTNKNADTLTIFFIGILTNYVGMYVINIF